MLIKQKYTYKNPGQNNYKTCRIECKKPQTQQYSPPSFILITVIYGCREKTNSTNQKKTMLLKNKQSICFP